MLWELRFSSKPFLCRHPRNRKTAESAGVYGETPQHTHTHTYVYSTRSFWKRPGAIEMYRFRRLVTSSTRWLARKELLARAGRPRQTTRATNYLDNFAAGLGGQLRPNLADSRRTIVELSLPRHMELVAGSQRRVFSSDSRSPRFAASSAEGVLRVVRARRRFRRPFMEAVVLGFVAVWSRFAERAPDRRRSVAGGARHKPILPLRAARRPHLGPRTHDPTTRSGACLWPTVALSGPSAAHRARPVGSSSTQLHLLEHRLSLTEVSPHLVHVVCHCSIGRPSR